MNLNIVNKFTQSNRPSHFNPYCLAVYPVSNRPPLIIARSRVDFHKLFSGSRVSQWSNQTNWQSFYSLSRWLIAPDIFQRLDLKPFQCSTTVTHHSAPLFETQMGDPPPQSHISLFFSLATITINSSTSEGSEEQLRNHMHPLLVSWRPSWLYWSVSLILHRFDSLFSHPFS